MEFPEIIETYEKAKRLINSLEYFSAKEMLEKIAKDQNCPDSMRMTVLRELKELDKLISNLPKEESKGLKEKETKEERETKEEKSDEFVLMDINKIKLIKQIEELMPISEDDFKRLERGILKKGIQTPLIVTPDNYLLAGYNRYKIAKKYGIEKVPVLIKDIQWKDRLEFAIRDNVERRHLSAEDIANIISKFKLAGQGRPKKDSEEKTTAELAEMLGVSHSTIDRAKQFLKKTEEKLEEMNKSVKSLVDNPSVHKSMTFEFVEGVNLDEENLSSALASVADEIFNFDIGSGEKVKVTVQIWLIKK